MTPGTGLWSRGFCLSRGFPFLHCSSPARPTPRGQVRTPGPLKASAGICFTSTANTVPCPQHVVFSIGRILDLLVPDIPESVEVKVKREYYLAKQALAENEVSPSALYAPASPSLIHQRHGAQPSALSWRATG